MAHVRIRYAVRGGHVHCSVWSTEGGAETTHGSNGRLIFRWEEFLVFRGALQIGGGPIGTVEFVEEESSDGDGLRVVIAEVPPVGCPDCGTILNAETAKCAGAWHADNRGCDHRSLSDS